MENKNDNLEKNKMEAEDAKESDTVNKIKNATAEVAQKIIENETVKKVADRIQQNEHIQKIKASKYSKLIKFGAIALAVILVVGLFSAVFGDKNAKNAEEKLISEYTKAFETYGAQNLKVDTKLIAQNKEANMYCFDATATCKINGVEIKDSCFTVVYSDGEDTYFVAQYEYENENKSIKKVLALSALSRG